MTAVQVTKASAPVKARAGPAASRSSAVRLSRLSEPANWKMALWKAQARVILSKRQFHRNRWRFQAQKLCLVIWVVKLSTRKRPRRIRWYGCRPKTRQISREQWHLTRKRAREAWL